MTTGNQALAPGAKTDDAFPKGHPGNPDWNPASPEAIEWARKNIHPLGERDFPPDHPGAADTAGNLNSLEWAPGVDPMNPHREPHTGRTPEQAAGVARLSALASLAAVESPVLQPVDAVEVATALNAKRKQVGRDVLTPEEFSAVMAEIQKKPRAAESPETTAAKINVQHQALAVLLGKGFTRTTALEVIARQGAEKVLADNPPAA